MEEIIIGKVGYDDTELRDLINEKADADHTHDELQEIENLIPVQASATNQLADKDFVNSSISTATAEFIGTFNSLTELQATTKTYDNNDYAFVIGEDENGSNYSRYKWNGSEWVFEYTLNNSSFTAEQWKAINSNVTDEWRQSVNTSISNKVDKVSGKGLSTNDYTTAEKNKLAGLSNYDDSALKSLINGKADINGSTADFQANNHFYKSLGTWKDYEQVVIPILEITASTTANRYSNGKIFSHRDNGLYADPIVEWKCNKMYNATASEKHNLIAYKLNHFKFATFEYNEKKYLGVLWNYTASQPIYCYFDGYTNDINSPMFTVIPYYNSNTKVVLNEEIKNSLVEIISYDYGALATKSVADKNGNDITTTYATKTDLNGLAVSGHTHNEFVKTAQLTKSDGTTNTFYYLIAKSLGTSSTSNCDTIFIDGSDYNNRMFEGVIITRGSNTVYNYGKNDLPLEFYSQTDGTINVYWKVSNAYNKVALSISSSSNMTVYSGNISNTTPTGTKMNFGTYDYKAVANMNIKNFGSPSNTTRYVELSSAENFAGVEVNIAYAGKWYFSIPGSAPLYLGSGGKTYSDYGFQGYAWGTDNKKLYLRFTGYRGVSISVLGANTNVVSISDWTTTAPTLPSGVSWKNDEYDIKANIDGKANITHTHGTNLSLGSYYYYSADVGTKFYWFKIIDGTVFNASNKHIRLQFNLASDNNFYYKSEYVLDVSYYATSATKNLSVALTNIYANSTKADSNIAIAVDENYNVYAQFNCIWESYVNITKLLGNIDFVTTKGSYAAFDTVAGFTSKAKITRNGCCKLTKNTSTNAISVSAIEDSYTYSTAVKAVNDKNGKDIAATYATTSSVSSSINTAMSGVINQVAASLNNYATKSELNNYVKQGGYKFDIYKYDSTLPTESGRLFIVEF